MNSSNLIPTEDHQFLSSHFLEPHLIAFSQELFDQGFTALTIRGYIDSVSHFGTWLHKKEISLGEIDRDVVSNFAKHRCYCPGGRKKRSVSGEYVKRVQRFINYLGQQGVICLQPTITKNPVPSLLLRFRELLRLRGLTVKTIAKYERALAKLLPLLGDDPQKYDIKTVRQTIGESAKQHSLPETKIQTTVLRAYLRFLSVEQLCLPDLDCAVPTVAQWQLSSLPRYITAQEVERVIDSCDIDTQKGLRDQAIILLLSRLGLRAGDIVAMRLDDINWNDGTLRVKGKGNREDLLPLPQGVGDAILAYLDKARPMVTVAQLFLCLNAPHRPFSSSSPVASIVDTALSRAGIKDPPSRGAHLLRHSAATAMLRSGATLETVSSILRHRSLDMTAYYAKIDVPRLKQIAQPWPEGESC